VIDIVANIAILACGALAISLVFYGWGRIAFSVLGLRGSSLFVTLPIWVGFCVVLLGIELIHLFIAIDWRVGLAVTGIGLIRTVLVEQIEWQKKIFELVAHIKNYPGRSSVVALFVLTASLHALQLPTMYDSGLYHFTSIRWLNEYPIALGLGNLHWRLALNQSYFGYLALLNFFPFWDRGYALGGFFLLLLCAATLCDVAKFQSKLWATAFLTVLLLYLSWLSVAIANPSPDIAVSLVQVAIFIFLFCLLSLNTLCPEQRLQCQVGVIFLCVAVATIKLSSIVFALTCALMVLTSHVRQLGALDPSVRKSLIVLSAFITLHVLRGYLLSGAPFFPHPFATTWSLPWAVQQGVAHFESALIYAWAKQPGISLPSEVSANYGWLPAWISVQPRSAIILFVATVAMTLVDMAFRIKATFEISYRQSMVLYVPIWLSIAFWFLTAPDLRFLGAILALYLAFSVWRCMLIVRAVIDLRSIHIQQKSNALIFVAISGVTLAFLLKWNIFDVKNPPRWESLPLTPVSIMHSRFGSKIFVPQEGAQCWDAPLPCAVGVHPGLQLLKLSDLTKLSKVVGDRPVFLMD
jgi:hypothetical protein